jgi:hypothetical protein
MIVIEVLESPAAPNATGSSPEQPKWPSLDELREIAGCSLRWTIAMHAICCRFGRYGITSLRDDGSVTFTADGVTTPLRARAVASGEWFTREASLRALLIMDDRLKVIAISANSDQTFETEASSEVLRRDYWLEARSPMALHEDEGQLHVLWSFSDGQRAALTSSRSQFSPHWRAVQHWTVDDKTGKAGDSPWPDLRVRRVGPPLAAEPKEGCVAA